MPTYQSHCNACKLTGDVRLSFIQYDEIKQGTSSLVCNSCDGKCEILFNPSGVSFILRDGVSGGWQSKALKENAYRSRRRSWLARREKDNVFTPQLQPNFDGVETGSWVEARDFARSEISKEFGKDIGNKVARTFDPFVRKGT